MPYTEPVIPTNQDKYLASLSSVDYDMLTLQVECSPSLNPGAPTPAEMFQEFINLAATHYPNIYAVRKAPAESICTPDEPEE